MSELQKCQYFNLSIQSLLSGKSSKNEGNMNIHIIETHIAYIDIGNAFDFVKRSSKDTMPNFINYGSNRLSLWKWKLSFQWNKEIKNSSGRNKNLGVTKTMYYGLIRKENIREKLNIKISKLIKKKWRSHLERSNNMKLPK